MPNTNKTEMDLRAQAVLEGIPEVLDAVTNPVWTSLEPEASGLFRAEAIVYNVGRPALFITDGQISPTAAPPWDVWFAKHGLAISTAARSVGRISVAGLNPRPEPATGFLVADEVILTCQHVLDSFTTGVPGDRELRRGAKPSISFRAESGITGAQEIPIIGVLGEHPMFDAVLLRIAKNASLPEPLSLAKGPWTGTKPCPVVVIGHPATLGTSVEPIYHEIFPPPYEVKRVSPGLATRKVGVDLVFHDASTWTGNSGSAVIDFATGLVVGLHFGGAFHVENHAAPAWMLTAKSFVPHGEAPSGGGRWWE